MTEEQKWRAAAERVQEALADLPCPEKMYVLAKSVAVLAVHLVHHHGKDGVDPDELMRDLLKAFAGDVKSTITHLKESSNEEVEVPQISNPFNLPIKGVH